MSDGVKEKKTCWKKGWSIIKPSPELIFDFTLVTTLLEIGFIYRQIGKKIDNYHVSRWFIHRWGKGCFYYLPINNLLVSC